MDELESTTPDEGIELYLDHRRREVSDATLASHKSRLGYFIDWCGEQETDNLNDLTGRNINEFRIWRRNLNGGIAPVTEKSQMDTLSVFIRFLETLDAVRNDLSEQVVSPDLDDGDNVRDVMLESDRAERILHYLSKFGSKHVRESHPDAGQLSRTRIRS